MSDSPTSLAPQSPETPSGGDAPKAGAQVPLLVFTLGTERYAVELCRAREILRYRRPARLPHVRPFLEGVIAVRGEVMPVVDLGRMLGTPASVLEERHRLVVVAAGDGSPAALHVDEVVGVRRLEAACWPQETKPGAPARSVTVDGASTRLIEVDTLLEWGESRG